MYVIHIQTVPTTMVDSDVPVTRDGEGLVNIPCVLISTSALKELTGNVFPSVSSLSNRLSFLNCSRIKGLEA